MDNKCITEAYIRLAFAIIQSGVKENDISFCKSDWCYLLRDYVGDYYCPNNSNIPAFTQTSYNEELYGYNV